AVLPQRPRADHLRGHDPDPQAHAGRARARLPRAERPRRRGVADLLMGARARARPRTRLESPAPGKLVSLCADSCADGVVPDVRAGVREVLVVAQHARVEAILEEVADTAMALVEPL